MDLKDVPTMLYEDVEAEKGIFATTETPQKLMALKPFVTKPILSKLECDRINPITGEATLFQTDFVISGRIPITWSRNYHSGNSEGGLLGYGWQCPADARLKVQNEGAIRFFDGDRIETVFDTLPTKTPVTEAIKGTLLTATDKYYLVKLNTGLTYYFPKEFSGNQVRVECISNIQRHFIYFDRVDEALTQIRDSCGQCTHIRCKKGRIISMVRHDKPLVEYCYRDNYLTAAVDALGHQRRFFYRNGFMIRHMDKNKRSTYFKYGNNGRCISTWDDSGICDYQFEDHPTECRVKVTNSLGYNKVYNYDANQRLVKIKDHIGATKTYDYDQFGRIVAVTDELDRCVTYEYDASGNVTKITRPDNKCITVRYDNGYPVQQTNANGKIHRQKFDEHGRLVEWTGPLDEKVRFKYNRHGDIGTIIDAEGVTTSLKYDEYGRICAVGYDGQIPTRYQRGVAGNITAVIDPSGRTNKYVYDIRGRMIQSVQPSGISQSFDWDPEDNLIMHTDPNGRQTRFEYNSTNKITRRINADGKCVSFQYDTENNLIGIINERSQYHHYQYNHACRLASQTDYYGHTRKYIYNAAGQLLECLYPTNKSTTYTYDDLGRLQSAKFGNNEQATFSWDMAGNLTAFQSTDVSVERTYDDANNLLAEKKNSFWVKYQYDRNGHCIQRMTSHGNCVKYTYGPLGVVSAIQINDQPPMTIVRNDQGQIMSECFGPFLQRSFSYDEDGLLSRQTINSAEGEIERRYTYDGAANLIAKHDTHKGVWRFCYDAMNRIVEAMDPQHHPHQLTYDACGDLLEHLPDLKEDLRCARYADTTYTFDIFGNLVQYCSDNEKYRLTWNQQNQLKSVLNGEKLNVTMTYDALARRHSKAVNGKLRQFNWDGYALLSEQPEDAPVREYVYYPGTCWPVAVIEDNRQIFYYHNDLNGLPQELTKSNGEIVWSADYNALGAVNQIFIDNYSQPLRLLGQYFDEEINLCFDGQRYFNPRICSYISQHPQGPIAGENTYTYLPGVWNKFDVFSNLKSLRNSGIKPHRCKSL